MVLFNDFFHESKLKNEARSDIKIQQVFSLCIRMM